MMFSNPELQKHIWREFSPLRLAITPFLLAIVAAICVKIGLYPSQNLFIASAVIFYLSTVLSANRDASSAFREEHKNNTWDFLRMSSVSPRTLAIGQLFGSISYSWYFGIGGLAIGAFSAIFYEHMNVARVLLYCLLLAFASLVGNAAALLSSVADIATAKTSLKKKSFFGGMPFMCGFAVAHAAGILVAFYIMRDMAEDKFPEMTHFLSKLTWYNFNVDPQQILLVTLFFFSFWVFAGLYRAVRSALLYKSTPTGWVIFQLSTVTYLFGFNLESNIFAKACLAGMFFLIAAYATMIAEAGDLDKYRRLAAANRKKQTLKIFENMPLWIPSASLCLMTYLALIIYAQISVMEPAVLNYMFFLGSCMLLAMRDTAIVHLLKVNRKIGHKDYYTIVFYALAYYLLPSLFGSSEETYAYFYPRIHNVFDPHYTSQMQELVIQGGEAIVAIAVLWLYARRTKIFNPDALSPPEQTAS